MSSVSAQAPIKSNKSNITKPSKTVIHVLTSSQDKQSPITSMSFGTSSTSNSTLDTPLHSARSDTTTVAIDSVVVIQDLKLELNASRRENHDLRSAEEPIIAEEITVVLSAEESVEANTASSAENQELVAQIERLQQEKNAHLVREEQLIAQVGRLDARNVTLIQGIDIRDKTIEVMENSRKRLRADIKKLQDEKEEVALSQSGLARQVRQLQADNEALERSKSRNRDDLRAGIEKLRLGKIEAEAKVMSLIRKISKLEREKATLAGDNKKLVAENAKLVAENNNLVEQSNVHQEEYESLKAYANDLENQYHLLETDIIALQPPCEADTEEVARDEDEGGLVQPHPLDFTGLGQANVKLLEDVACLEHQQEALLLQSKNLQNGECQHAGSTAVHDAIQHFAIRLRDICAIGSMEGDIAAEIMFGKVEELQADTEARLEEEQQKLCANQAVPATPNQTGSKPTDPTGQFMIVVANEDGDDIASQTSDGEERLLQLRNQVILRLYPDGQSALDVTTLFTLPVTPLAPSYHENECNDQSLQESQDGSDESSVLGTPMPKEMADLSCQEDVFRTNVEAVAREDDDFTLKDAPPCHFDEYAWQWVHDDDFEEEDMEAEDAITPSPTTYHVCDANKDDLFAANREAAFESGEMF